MLCNDHQQSTGMSFGIPFSDWLDRDCEQSAACTDSLAGKNRSDMLVNAA